MLLLRASCGQQGLDGAIGQQRAQGETHVGALHHLAAGGMDQLGQSLTAEGLRVLQPLPPAFGKLLEGLLEARGGPHLTVVERRRVSVTFPVQGRHHFLIEARAFLKHGSSSVGTGIRVARKGRHSLQTRQLLHHEEHVLQGCAISHFSAPDATRAPHGRPRGVSMIQRALTSSGTAAKRSASSP